MDREWQFWVDRGGTFTDVLALSPDGSVTTAKYLSENPEAYEDATLHAIRRFLDLDEGDKIPGERISAIKMGTTVATNALLERSGEPTVFVTTAGLGDLIEIGNQTRPDTFALKIEKPDLLHGATIEVNERIRADGTVERELDEAHARTALRSAYREGYRTVAIALMHAFRYPQHETALARIAREIGFAQISVSHEVSPLARIVPRAQTSVVDAYLTPVLRRYVDRFADAFAGDEGPGALRFMQSSGGLAAARAFRGRDAILSGPAGGVVGCVATARAAGFDRVIGFDMGGTSTDVSHYSGDFEKVYETRVAGVEMRVPMLDIHTVAAGGGSVLKFEDGRFKVGPGSAGADPGPACYRRGGPLAVTDINAFLGKLQPDHFPAIFGPEQDQKLDVEASRKGFEAIASELGDGRRVEEIAEGFLEIANEHMAQAIKQVSIARGHDVKDYVLNCFGGAGGQHACLVAERLGIGSILVHRYAGVLSAYGIGLAALRTERQEVIGDPLDPGIENHLESRAMALGKQCVRDLIGQGAEGEEVRLRASTLLRYKGTDTVLKVELGKADAMRADFDSAHERQFGFTADEKQVLVDTLVVEASAGGGDLPRTPRVARREDAPEPIDRARFFSRGEWHKAPVHAIERLEPGHSLAGPAIVIEPTGTVVVEPGWSLTVDGGGNLHLSVESARSDRGASEEVDPVTLEVFNNLFMSIAEQMGIVLRNTAQSVNVKERLDFSCAVFDPEGNLVANAPHVPVHLGSMDETVKTVIASGQAIDPGDAFVQNNPHKGGSHLPDITVVTPVFDENGAEPIFFTASRAHHEDIGGITPGSMSPEGRTIEDEGVVLDNLKLVERGKFMSERIEAALGSGPHPARNIEQNVADLMAQVAANAAGARELVKLARSYTLPVVHAYMGHIQDNAEQAVRQAIRTLADGSFHLDLDSGARIAVAVKIDHEAGSAHVDFTGTSAQADNAFNAPRAVTRAAVLYVMRCLVADAIPLNAGCMKPIEIIVPEGSLLNPRWPAAVVAGNVETSQAITDALFAALGRLGTSQGTMNNLTFGNDRLQYYETICSGAPASPGFDGAAAVHTHMTNTRMTDPEVLELRYPVVLDRFSVDRGSGGCGRWNAGDGVTRKIRFLEPMTCSILSERREVAAPGLRGGESGRLGRNRVIRASGKVEDLGGCDRVEMEAGDAIEIRSPTGGGFGSLDDRVEGGVDT